MSQLGQEGCIATILATVQASGFAMFNLNGLSLVAFFKLLKRNGYSISQTVLTAKDQSPQLHKKTLSGIYGRDAFPYHTDYAFKPTPPKFIVLANESSQCFERPTFVSSLSGLPPDMAILLKDSLWILKNRLGTFIVSSYQTAGDQLLLRWDLDFLMPYNDAARRSAESIPPYLAAKKKAVSWNRHSAVMIDNWICAHARAAAPLDDEPRRLVRYEVWNHA